MSGEDEEWVDLTEKDVVFETAEDGRVSAFKTKNERGMFGGIVRERDGKWQKRVNPLTILDPAVIDAKLAAEHYVSGAHLIGQRHRDRPQRR